MPGSMGDSVRGDNRKPVPVAPGLPEWNWTPAPRIPCTKADTVDPEALRFWSSTSRHSLRSTATSGGALTPSFTRPWLTSSTTTSIASPISRASPTLRRVISKVPPSRPSLQWDIAGKIHPRVVSPARPDDCGSRSPAEPADLRWVLDHLPRKPVQTHPVPYRFD